MEAAGALGRGSPSNFADAVRQAVRDRSRVFWIVAGLTVLAASLRFATLGLQAYHHDEIVTASRVLRGSFWHAMDAVGFSESAPPLYYALAWLWTQLTGTGEFGLRSLSALAGVATVPVAYMLGVELRGHRAGLATAALVAVNPMLVWYSQEARGYALLVLATTISALYFVRALDGGHRRDFIGWGIASGLALATHYFAVFPIALQVVWLLWRRGWAAWRGLWIIVAAGLALAPLMIHQASEGRAEWIGGNSLGHRLWETAFTFATGEVGDIIARPERPLLGVVPVALILAALALSAARGDAGERRRNGLMLALVGATLAIPVAIALVMPSKDFILARNLLPALVPLLAAVAVGITLRRARRTGVILGVALFAYSLGFSILASVAPSLQRPDWDAVAARIGEPREPRAMVTWTLGLASLRYYLPIGSIQVTPADGYDWLVGEVDFVSDGPAPPPASRMVPGMRQVAYGKVGRLYVRRYETPGPGLAPLRLREARKAQLGFRNNGILLDGIGPE
ncbi:MAG TPA: glycosyltransferase family 39 protein [Solirubrobacterales bacterium]